MRGPESWWRSKSTPAKVETYTRWSFHFFGLLETAVIAMSAFGETGPRLAGTLTLLVGAHAALCAVTASRSLDFLRGLRPRPVRALWTLAAATGVLSVGALALALHGPSGDGVDTAGGAVLGTVTCFGAGTMALAARDRRQVVVIVACCGAGAGTAALVLGMPVLGALVTACVVLVGSGLLAMTSLFSVWLLNAVYALDEARETRVRLAVAEERLRFGRDLHDVMGRNLAVIALKSELAVQLARRGRPEAVEQMIEAQRIAQESQREVRDVVRGYREADLGTELTGARGVLSAAGIDCRVTGEAAGLPAPVQSALGWVVREATTNVLRHGEAERCTVRVRTTKGRVVLTVENDGAVAPPGADTPAGAAGTGGSGLAGLRERLAAVGGTLEAGRVGEDLFRLVADVPLAAGPAREAVA
ncbi:histidine kinase [Streptomyces sp. SID8352]|uniref:sensor histidine kinase n=1 Tax=Streptomyces sp. SID8352 TaxID=2690338 RepID=UPI00136A1CFA|nr:histidine kinase [Streptomyces sp. SID8352]MYU25122.1 sensor histidine kinase [Streptomyces sp. SID8352]